jgi:hypothetical protein
MADTGSSSSRPGDGTMPSSQEQQPQDQGIVIEMNENNDVCINATHLTVKCDNSFLVSGAAQEGQKASAKTSTATVAGQKSIIVVQQPVEEVKRRPLITKRASRLTSEVCRRVLHSALTMHRITLSRRAYALYLVQGLIWDSEQEGLLTAQVPEQLNQGVCPAGNAAGAVFGLLTLRTVHRMFTWHWARRRTELALAAASTSDLLALLAHQQERTALAALTHIALDLQDSSNRRLRTQALAPFPPISDLELSRASAAASRARLAAARNTPLCHGARPASSLSISSVDTTPSCDGSMMWAQSQPVSPRLRPVSADAATGSHAAAPHPPETAAAERPAGDGASAPAALPPPPTAGPAAPAQQHKSCPCSVVEGSATGDGDARSEGDGEVSEAQGCPPRPCRRGGWPKGEPPGGRALSMLLERPVVWDAFVALIQRTLCGESLRAARDAAWALQVTAFASERLSQRLVDAGAHMRVKQGHRRTRCTRGPTVACTRTTVTPAARAGVVPLLLAAMADSYGVRLRPGGARLRQPGYAPLSLSATAALLSLSPLQLPSLHLDMRRRVLSFNPRGVNWGFLNFLPHVGGALHRRLSPRCRATAGKRQAAAEALQNVVALRAGARALLQHGAPLLATPQGTAHMR